MVFQYSDHRSYLKAVLQEKISRNPSYSLRALARQVGCATSTLSQGLNGKLNLSVGMIQKISRRLELSTRETEYLCLLSQLHAYRDPELKESLIARLKELNRGFRSAHELSVDEFKKISEWYHSAILEMPLLKDFEFTPVGVAARLGITKLQAECAFERLLRLGLLQQDENGRISRSSDSIFTKSETSNEALQKFYRQMLALAEKALGTQKPDERVSAFQTVAISKAALPEIKEVTRRYLNELIEVADRHSERSDVYHLSLHFFNLTQNERDPS